MPRSPKYTSVWVRSTHCLFSLICILRSGYEVNTNIVKCIFNILLQCSILFNLICFTVLFCSLLLNSSLKQSGNITADSFRKSFLEWEAVRFEVDKLFKKDHFDCPACSPDMLAVSVDGNRKHYRFKSAARYCVHWRPITLKVTAVNWK